MKIKPLLLSSLLALSPLVNAASLELPYTLELLALNGKATEDKALLSQLPEGKHQVVFHYFKKLRDGSKSDLYSSKPLVLELQVTESVSQYQLSHRAFYNVKDVERALKRNKMNWELDADGQAVPVEVEHLTASGVLPFADIEKAIRNHNKKKGIILTSTGTQNIQDAVVTVDKKTGKAEISGDPVTQLKLWYTKASKEEQKEFRRWLIDQE